MKKHNFSAGPAAIPREVLQRASEQLVDFHGYGLSLLELSHRGKTYEEVHNRCLALLRELLQVPQTHDILLLAGGATLQFAMAPVNLLSSREQAQKVSIALSGSWAQKAYEDLKLLQKVAGDKMQIHVAWDGKAVQYRDLGSLDPLGGVEGSHYLHICSNETIDGVQWPQWPQAPCPIVADMSSDILTRPIDWAKFSVVYAGAQKNLGPAGVCLVVLHKDVLENANPELPAYLRYDVHAKANSLYNTPPAFAIYMMLLQLEWAQQQEGLAGIQAQNAQKAQMLYEYIDSSGGFYQNPVDPRVRSQMNVPFLLHDAALDPVFLQHAAEAGFEGLKGHRSVGGMRASIYNAVSLESVTALVSFMEEFRIKQNNG